MSRVFCGLFSSGHSQSGPGPPYPPPGLHATRNVQGHPVSKQGPLVRFWVAVDLGGGTLFNSVRGHPSNTQENGNEARSSLEEAQQTRRLELAHGGRGEEREEDLEGRRCPGGRACGWRPEGQDARVLTGDTVRAALRGEHLRLKHTALSSGSRRPHSVPALRLAETGHGWHRWRSAAPSATSLGDTGADPSSGRSRACPQPPANSVRSHDERGSRRLALQGCSRLRGAVVPSADTSSLLL